MTLRCYVCGETMTNLHSFVLFSLSEQADRVFVCDTKCVDRLGDNPNMIIVYEVTP